MLEVRDGSAAAFEQLVRRYQGRLITILEHTVRRRELAEDLAQEVFLRVYRARHSYVPGARFSTWLFTIAHNVASNAQRTLSRRKEVQMTEPSSQSSGAISLEQLAKAASGLMPTRQLAKVELAEIVSQAIQQLSDRQRMALLLSKFEGMSYIDIAATMGLSVAATKSLLSRARGNLKSILQPYIEQGELPVESGNGQSAENDRSHLSANG